MKKQVEVVLVENIDKLGLKGEEKKLARGYVKNYLLPKKIVMLSKDPKAREIIKKIKEERAKLEAEIVEIKKIAEKVSKEEIIVKTKSGEKGKLFGSITSDDIAKKLKVDKKLIKMQPIRNIGKHQVEINFGYNIIAKAKIIVEAQEDVKKKTSKKK